MLTFLWLQLLIVIQGVEVFIIKIPENILEIGKLI